MTAAVTSSFWAGSFNPFTTSSVSAFFNYFISFMKSGTWLRKMSETPSGTSSTEIIDVLASLFPNRLLFMASTNIMIIKIYDKQEKCRSAARFLFKNSEFPSFSVDSENPLNNDAKKHILQLVEIPYLHR